MNNKFICQCKELSLEEIEMLKKEYGINTLKELVKKQKQEQHAGDAEIN